MGMSARTKIGVLLIFVSAFVFDYSKAMWDIRTTFRGICADLTELKVDTFMEKSVNTFEHICKSMVSTNYLAFRNIYNDILATTFAGYNQGSLHFERGPKPGLKATNNITTFLLEFTVGKNGSQALAAIEKYKDEYYASKLDILCVGINFQYVQAPPDWQKKIGSKEVDVLKCDWEAKLYSCTGELIKSFPPNAKDLPCP